MLPVPEAEVVDGEEEEGDEDEFVPFALENFPVYFVTLTVSFLHCGGEGGPLVRVMSAHCGG